MGSSPPKTPSTTRSATQYSLYPSPDPWYRPPTTKNTSLQPSSPLDNDGGETQPARSRAARAVRAIITLPKRLLRRVRAAVRRH